jgi:hypothetical protein
MRATFLAIPTAAALLLGACGSETSGTFTTEEGETGEYTIDRESGESTMTVDTPDGEVTMRTGADVPVSLPAGFTLIGGAEVVSNTTVDQGGTKGALLAFTSDKSPEEIADHYRAEAREAGITIQIETSMNGGKMIGGKNEATGTTFSVNSYPGEEGTTSQLTISEEGG